MKTRTLVIIMVFPMLFILGLSIYNGICNDKFWEASATTCFSLFVAAILSFFLAQRQTDRRKQKEIFIQLLESLKNIVDDERSYKLKNSSKEEILMRKRDMSNKIQFVKKYSETFSIKKEIDFIEEKFTEYDSVIGDHIEDLETLGKLDNELGRPLSLMSQKIFEVMLNLFK